MTSSVGSCPCSMTCPRPDVRRPGCEARGKAEGLPFYPAATGEGKIGRVNTREPLVDAS